MDFNCLFEQGKLFPKPERVPFRLTHNMINAMGLSGYDGDYRISCEKTLQVFRDNLESLASVLEGFVHDPLLEWKSKRKGQQIQQDQEGDVAMADAQDIQQQSERAQDVMTVFKRKVVGRETGPDVQPIRSQVELLIRAATSSENLANMYIGWSAFL